MRVPALLLAAATLLAALVASADDGAEHDGLFKIRHDAETEARLRQEAMAAERRMLDADREDVQSELAGEFVHAALRIPDQDVNFQVSKILEAMMRRKMKEEAPRCGHDLASGTFPPPGGPQERPRGVIAFILVELDGMDGPAAEELRRDLALALRCWSRHLPGYPLLVFHTAAVSSATLARLAAAVPSGASLEFAEISVEVPERMAADPDAFFAGRCINDAGEDRWRAAAECGCRCGGLNMNAGLSDRVSEGTATAPGRCWPLAWMHSMRLATAGIFRHPALAEGDRFDYIALVNADLFLVRPPRVDPFVLLQRCGCAMAYDRFSLEVPGCYDSFQERLGAAGLPHPMIGTGPAAIGGQLMVARLSLLTSDSYLRVADYLAEGIYLHRWGDQLFFAAAVQALQVEGGHAAWGGLDDPAVNDYAASYGVCLHDMFYELPEPPDISGWSGPSAASNATASDGPLFIHRKGSWRDGRVWWACGP